MGVLQYFKRRGVGAKFKAVIARPCKISPRKSGVYFKDKMPE